MLDLAIRNSAQTRLQITGNDAVYQLISVTGLDPVQAALNMANVYGADGSKFVSAKLNNRNVVIMARINGNVEANRQVLYRLFPPKEPVTLEISTGARSVTIAGYVEYIKCDIFDRSERAQISVICPDPLFRSAAQTSLTGSFTGASGAIEFDNTGDSPAYFDLQFTAADHTGFTLTAPSGEYITVTNSDAGMLWIPDYSANGKNVFLTNNGTTVSVLENLSPRSVFFLLPKGQSQLALSVPGASGCSWALSFYNCFEGV